MPPAEIEIWLSLLMEWFGSPVLLLSGGPLYNGAFIDLLTTGEQSNEALLPCLSRLRRARDTELSWAGGWFTWIPRLWMYSMNFDWDRVISLVGCWKAPVSLKLAFILVPGLLKYFDSIIICYPPKLPGVPEKKAPPENTSSSV